MFATERRERGWETVGRDGECKGGVIQYSVKVMWKGDVIQYTPSVVHSQLCQ